jgi:uncharacterized peroxidase-related enzyme
VTLDAELAAALRRDYREADLTPPERAMLDFAVKLTEQPARMTAADVQALRDAGFNDQAVLQITMIAAFFNYINRVADALGVGADPGSDRPPTTSC